MQEMWVGSLSWEDPLEKEMATHSSILAWEIPWTERSLVGYSPFESDSKESDTSEVKEHACTLAHSIQLSWLSLPTSP